MADTRSHVLKRNLFYCDKSDSDNSDVVSSDDSVKDRDYMESESSSNSSQDSSDQENDNVETLTVADMQPTPITSRGILPTPEKQTPSRWKRPRTEWRKKEKKKIRRNLGHSYKNHKGIEVSAKEIGPACTCKKKCREQLKGKEQSIFKSFWDLGDYNKQNIYLYSRIKTQPKKRTYPKKTKKQDSSRNISVEYFVKVNGGNVKVCKKEFLSVHGLQHSRKRVELLYKKMSNGALSTPQKDKRGVHKNRPNKTPDELLQSARNHINAIPKYTSHYSRKKNGEKVFIGHDLNISKLYKDYYVDWCKERDLIPVSEDKYRRIFCTEYNIGFKLPKSDTCKTCDMLKIKIEDLAAGEEEIKCNRIKLELHQRKAEAMQQGLKAEVENAKVNGDAYVITFDLQQALPVPNLTVGPAFYLRKAWVYNQGVHDCITGQGYMYMWPENVAKRGSDEIASIIYKYFRENSLRDNKKLIVYTDNCSGQNKNWSIMCLWQQLVADGWFKSVEHRFLIVGHTHLPCDRDFAIIERYKKGMKQVYEPNDWYQAVQKAKRTNPFVVNIIKQEDILLFKDLQCQIVKKNVLDDKDKLKFNQVTHFKFCQEDSNKMYVKHAINEEFRSVTIKKRGIRNSISLALKDLRRKYNQLLPLNNKKVSNLSELVKYIPPAYIGFYQEIGACNAVEDINLEQDEVEELDAHSSDEENINSDNE